MYFLYFFNTCIITDYYIILLKLIILSNKIKILLILMIFVLKFGAWCMSVFATDRRYILYL
jgi:hypothetical protein